MVFNSGWQEDLAQAMANSGIRLHKAILIAANACERCMNALAYEHGLDWGYEEMSEDWKKCGTECDFCKGMGYARESVGENATLASRVAVRFFDIDDRAMTASEMEPYCPDCAEEIRAGELQVTRDEFRHILVEIEQEALKEALNETH